MRALSPGAQRLLGAGFAVRRAWYRLRYPRLEIGAGVLFIGRLKLRAGTRLVLGDRVRIRKTVIVNGGGTVVVGPDTLLNGCWIGAREAVSVGAWCLISDCNISDNDFHNLLPRERHGELSPKAVGPVEIGDNVWVGARAIVLKGSRLGADSVIGSGAVVRGPVPEGVVMAGNPAQIVRRFTTDERTARPSEGPGVIPVDD